MDYLPQRHDDPRLTLAEQRRQDVFADPLAPQMVAAVAPRQVCGIEVNPMGLCAASDQVLPRSYSLSVEFEAPFQPIQVDSAGAIKIDGRFARPMG